MLTVCALMAAAVPPAPAAEPSLMEKWRQFVQPGLREAEERLHLLRRELTTLPGGDSRPDFSRPGYRSLSAATPREEKWVQVDLGRTSPVDDIVLVPAVMPAPGGAAVTAGFPVRFRVDVSNDEFFSRAETVADFTAADQPDPGPMPVVIRKAGRRARYVRVTAVQLRGEPDNYFLALGELVVCSGNRNVAQGARVMALDSFESPRWSLDSLTDGSSVAGRPVEQRSRPTNGYHAREETRADLSQWVQVDLGAALPLDEVRLVPARPVDFADTIGFGFPVRFRVEVSADEAFTQPVTIADHTAEDFPNPGDRRVVLPARGTTGRFVRVTAVKLWPRHRTADFVFALAEMEVISRGVNAAAEKPVTDSSPLEVKGTLWAPEFLVDGIAPPEGLGTYAEWLSALAKRHIIDGEIAVLSARASLLRDSAESRLAWIACGAGAGIVCAGALAVWISRVRQRRQSRRLRARIARDLHDDIGSNLSSIALLSQLGLDAGPDFSALRPDLEEIHRVATQTADSMHDIVWLISPGSKSSGDLVSRLRETAGRLLAGLDWKMQTDGLESRRSLPLELQRDLFLVFKEALHNIRRHAGARRVEISLTPAGRSLTLRISDDGCGFNPASVRRGHGLDNMEKRAAACRARLTVESSPGHGTVLVLHIPRI
jgi:signal transduction histidine kinase